MTPEAKKAEAELLEICEKFSGEYRPSHHGSGSWATTYSNEFLAAAAELWFLYKSAGKYPIGAMSRAFQDAGIRSCRGSRMSFDRVEYLYETHLKRRV